MVIRAGPLILRFHHIKDDRLCGAGALEEVAGTMDKLIATDPECGAALYEQPAGAVLLKPVDLIMPAAVDRQRRTIIRGVTHEKPRHETDALAS
jgi:hypothetical protein